MRASYQLSTAHRTFCCATFVNISKGGVAFYSTEEVEEGSQVDLNIHFDEDTPTITLTTTVKWNKRIGDTGQYLCGVEILNAEDSAERQQFNECIDKLAVND